MANKNPSSRAEKAVSNAKKKTAAPAKTTAPKTPRKPPVVKTGEEAARLPKNASVAIFSFLLFVIFLVASAVPEGKGVLLELLRSLVEGLIGQVGFFFSIPALLYLSLLHVFYPRQANQFSRICVWAFVFLCSCIHHLMVQPEGLAVDFSLIPALFTGGIAGTSGGVLCGLLAMLIRWALYDWMAYILLASLAVVALLGAMNITIPSIIRAVMNRPRQDWEDDEEEEEYMEPVEKVINTIAQRRIDYKRRRREARLLEEQAYDEEDEEDEEPFEALPLPKPARKPEPKPAREDVPFTGKPAHGANVMSAMDSDISAPVGAAGEAPAEKPPKSKITFHQPGAAEPEFLPNSMPELDLSQDLPSVSVPKQEKKDAPEEKPDKVSSKDAAAAAAQVAKEIAEAQTIQKPVYNFPPINLLKRPPRGGADGTEEMRENSRRLNETLESFKIDAHITNVTRGPSVTRYEVELDKGVRLSKLTGCADDIALSLGAPGVRIAAVPGKISIVGIEVPNRAVTTVSLREVIDSSEFSKAQAKATFSVGKSIDGNCIVGNIGKMPHMLIAGTTGSGKSVCMNSIIISLLYKAGPEDVKLIMVDPKMVELGIYNGIPHLLIPVVTDPKKAAGSLQWAVTEMMRRYKLMSDMGVRDLESYNADVAAEDEGQKLPQVVVIIDELADLMLVAAKEVEDSICRIAQMGRAAGMHLIIATQRPSSDVITGLMKANIPSRIAFSVASAMESRIILDTMGAEKLVGKGDMLYAPIGSGKPLRVQGCFVTDEEVEAVATYVKDNYVADYDDNVMKEIEKSAAQTGKKSAPDPEPSDEELEGDELLPDAVDVILETGQASVSMLQRRLKLGYARAARIVDEMEEKGIVGPFQGSKPRAILITKEKWEAMQGSPQSDF